MPNLDRPAVVLLSGGMDSATVLAIARAQGFAVHALSLRYGQRHSAELDAAARVAQALGAVRHEIVDLDLAHLFVGPRGSALTDRNIAVPTEPGAAGAIPATYVPARNTIMLSLALGWAEVLGAADIFIGVNAIDYSGYPDCRPEFIAAFEHMANLATKSGVEGKTLLRIHTPLAKLDKAGIVKLAAEVGVDFVQTHSCYDPTPQGRPCGTCDSCQLRLKGFEEAGMADPVMTAP